MKILVTGAAGFIGAHCVLRLLRDGHSGVSAWITSTTTTTRNSSTIACDWVREQVGDFQLATVDLADASAIEALFVREQPEVVIHLAAQAGVRYSLENPRAYLDSNLNGFLNILESCRQHPVKHLIYASSSSVYGANQHTPYSVKDGVNHPLSLYAATKKANELMAHSYSHLFGIPCTGLRFFTVYGPWGRPDMSPIQFARAIAEGQPLKLFNYGEHQRDFTYIDDIIESIARLIEHPPQANAAMGSRATGPGQQHGAVADLQHRRPAPGGAQGLPGAAGKTPRPKSHCRVAAAATGRRAQHLRRRQRPGPGHRIPATYRAG